MKLQLNIKSVRNSKGYSQNELAKKLNISQGFLSAIENNKKFPSAEMFYKLSSALNVCPRCFVICTIECEKCRRDKAI